MLRVGDQAPAFPPEVRTSEGEPLSLDGLRGHGPVVLVLLRGFS